MAVSQATTMARTRGNSNGFHLDSAHGSIRGNSRGDGGAEGTEGRCVYMCFINVYRLSNVYIQTDSRKEVG